MNLPQRFRWGYDIGTKYLQGKRQVARALKTVGWLLLQTPSDHLSDGRPDSLGEGWRFRMEDGVCIEGACPGRALDPVPVEVLPGGALRIAVNPAR